MRGRKDYVDEKFQWHHRVSNLQPSDSALTKGATACPTIGSTVNIKVHVSETIYWLYHLLYAFGIPECTINVDTLDLFSRGPNDDSCMKHDTLNVIV
jgi:hypothetical protein